jgi:4-aminobutyrate aminotransferase/diaminobutyrate-pyruvate transaminase/4-aminobutyrate aminotransferase/(S)-3-amino-2-methylpropionate transaminase
MDARRKLTSMQPQPSSYVFSLEPVEAAPVQTAHRTIRTPIPHPEDIRLIKKIMEHESSLQDRELPIAWDHAEGSTIFDRWGNRWIDLSSTIFVTNSGHANPRARQRIRTVLEKGLLHSYCYPTTERAEFLDKLIEITPPYLDRASLISTGTEASERALKQARLYGQSISPDKNIIIGGSGNYHGKTLGAFMAAGRPEWKTWIGYQDPNMLQLPFPYPWALDARGLSGSACFEQDIQALQDAGMEPSRVAAFILEGYQGWGAVFYPKEYVQALAAWARKHQALIIVDEIQSGFGRTGKLFAFEHYDIEPDLVCCGKGISGSLPLSAVLGRSDIIEKDASLTSTHGGHPMACAGALGNLESLIEDRLVERSNTLGQTLKTWLLDWQAEFPDRIPRIEGAGMVWAVYISKPSEAILDANLADRLVERAMQKGVFLIRTGCGTIKLGPPLTIEESALKEAIDVIIESMRELLA